ncbi:hypothetical protein NIES2100_18030 [Calothrix sp. NIES-2100]|uniref:hypothetical protein n=1 Tax=Calothrix sp. NIES-2100 TaxID=1954172 RepID=UPI000B5F7809|nr:hypothetical protein NIES2100_18030 [Calothrix sp. NIES-2100]
MRVNAIAMTLVLSLAAARGAYAQNPDVTSEPFMKAALTVMTFDYFAEQCNQGSGFAASDAAKVEAWETTNGVAQIRARLPEFDQHPTQKQQLELALSTITKQIARQHANINPCTAAVSLSQIPDAQFAKVSPQILSLVSKPPKTPKKAAQPPAKTPENVTSASDSEIVKQIDSFGFNSRPKMGIGGFIVLDIYPVVLFRNGEALTNVEGLSFSGGIAAHKRANPDEWTRWRKQGGKIELANKDAWEALPFSKTYPKLPNNFKLNGLFRSLSGTGNVAIGGSQSVAAWQDYRFSSDGRVVRGNGAGASNEAIATSNVAPNQRGTYRVEGLTLYITYDDGSSEHRILITDPTDPSTIWLDGVSYVRRKK